MRRTSRVVLAGAVAPMMCATPGTADPRRMDHHTEGRAVAVAWRRLVCLPAGRRGKWLVLVGWVIVVGVFGWLAGLVGSVTDNDETNWMPAGAGSTRAAELAQREFPADDTVAMVVVYVRRGGLTAAD